MQTKNYWTRCQSCYRWVETPYRKRGDLPLKPMLFICQNCDPATKLQPAIRYYYQKFCKHFMSKKASNCLGCGEEIVMINTRKAIIENYAKSQCKMDELVPFKEG